MTKELLEQYPYICGELKDLECNGLFPQRRQKLAMQKSEIEAFVDSIEDSRVRRIITLRALEAGQDTFIVPDSTYYFTESIKRDACTKRKGGS